MTAKEYLQQLERADVIIEQKMKEQADLEELSKCVRAIDYARIVFRSAVQAMPRL